MTEGFTKKRFEDLAEKSYRSNCFTFTPFLNENELSEFYEIKHISPSEYTIFGGRENADRVMVRFGNPDDLGYVEDFPVKCIKIEPVSKKFAENLSHRDFLGAVMNLGIKRAEIGDIIVSENEACLFCTAKMSDYICREITRVRHTAVSCTITENIPSECTDDKTETEIQASSERIDGIVSKVFRISRNSCIALFKEKKIFVNGKSCENNSYVLKENDRVSVRGFGKFIFKDIKGTTRKGNKIIIIEKF